MLSFRRNSKWRMLARTSRSRQMFPVMVDWTAVEDVEYVVLVLGLLLFFFCLLSAPMFGLILTQQIPGATGGNVPSGQTGVAARPRQDVYHPASLLNYLYLKWRERPQGSSCSLHTNLVVCTKETQLEVLHRDLFLSFSVSALWLELSCTLINV